MPPYPESVTTSRLRLARWDVAAHTAGLAALNADPRTVEFLNGGTTYTAAESLRQSERFAAHWSAHRFGLWAIEPVEPIRGLGPVVGFTGLAHPLWFPEFAREVEIGWRLHPGAWGRGYATEAARAAIEAAAELPIHHLIAIIEPANVRSIAVASRLGMTRGPGLAHPQTTGTVTIFQLALGLTEPTAT